MQVSERAGRPDCGVRTHYSADGRETQRADCDLTDKRKLLNAIGACEICGLCCSIAVDATNSQRRIAMT